MDTSTKIHPLQIEPVVWYREPMLTDKDIREIMGEPDLTEEAAQIIRTIVYAFADLLIEHEEDELDGA